MYNLISEQVLHKLLCTENEYAESTDKNKQWGNDRYGSDNPTPVWYVWTYGNGAAWRSSLEVTQCGIKQLWCVSDYDGQK